MWTHLLYALVMDGCGQTWLQEVGYQVVQLIQHRQFVKATCLKHRKATCLNTRTMLRKPRWQMTTLPDRTAKADGTRMAMANGNGRRQTMLRKPVFPRSRKPRWQLRFRFRAQITKVVCSAPE